MIALVTRIVCTFVGSFAYCFLFQVRGKAMVYAPLGAVVTAIMVQCLEGQVPYAVQALLAAMAGATYAEIMARVQKEPVSAYLTMAILPTVPGRGIYNTMEYCINNEIDLFLKEGVTTFITAGMIASAIVVVNTFIQISREIRGGKV